MLAVIKLAGNQHIVKKNDIIITNKIDDEVGKEIVIQDVLSIIDEGKVQIGSPLLPNVSVKAKVLEQTRDKKVIVFKKEEENTLGVKMVIDNTLQNYKLLILTNKSIMR